MPPSLLARLGCAVLQGGVAAFAVLILVHVSSAQAFDRGGGEPALWSITDADSSVHLYGTFHLLPQDAAWRTHAVEQALAGSQVLVLEVPVGNGTDQALHALIRETGTNPPGVALSDRLGGEWAARYDRVLTSLGLPKQAIEPLRPWYASLVLTVQFAATQDIRPEFGVEYQLSQLAKHRKMRFDYLESAESQIEMMAGFSPSNQDAMIKSTLMDIEKADRKLETMIAAWQKGDLRALETLVLGSIQTMPDLYNQMIVARNRNWVPQIEAFLADDEDYFVAVGSAHLVGRDSVIRTLRKKGREVAGP